MSLSRFRLVQFSCVALVALGTLPWLLLASAMLITAVQSSSPLAMSVAAWVVLLVPLWVAWFAVAAWSKRDETSAPAVMMALPLPFVAMLFMLVPHATVVP